MKTFTPKTAILVIVLVLASAFIAVYFGKQKASLKNSAQENPDNESPENPTLAAKAEFSSTNSSNFDLDDTTISATPAPPPLPLENYIYTGAKILSQTETRLEMESSDDSLQITNWYKEKIRSSNFNAKSFAQTNTNGTILNKLSAVKPGEKLDITIKKDQSGSKVTITVDRS